MDMRSAITLVEGYQERPIRLAKNPSVTLPETDTCAIHSMALVTGLSADEVWTAARPYWRVRGGITNAHKFSILRALGYEMKSRYDLQYGRDKNGLITDRTLGQVLKLLEKEPTNDGFLIGVRDHSIGYKDGKIIDTANTGHKFRVRTLEQVIKKD